MSTSCGRWFGLLRVKGADVGRLVDVESADSRGETSAVLAPLSRLSVTRRWRWWMCDGCS